MSHPLNAKFRLVNNKRCEILYVTFNLKSNNPSAKKEENAALDTVVCDKITFCQIQNKKCNNNDRNHKDTFEAVSLCTEKDTETSECDFHSKEYESQSNRDTKFNSDIQKNIVCAIELLFYATNFDQCFCEPDRGYPEKEG